MTLHQLTLRHNDDTRVILVACPRSWFADHMEEMFDGVYKLEGVDKLPKTAEVGQYARCPHCITLRRIVLCWSPGHGYKRHCMTCERPV